MIVSSCPRCHESVRIPSLEISEGAEAECPWCGEIYLFDEVSRRLPPLLRIKGLDHEPDDESAAMSGLGIGEQGQVVVDLDADNDEFRYDFETAVEDPAGVAPMRVTPLVTKPRRRKSGGGFRRAIGIVLGGLLAIPFAGGILLLMGRAPDLGFWPFDGRRQTQVDRVNARRTALPDDPVGTSNRQLSDSWSVDPETRAFESIPEPVIGNDLREELPAIVREDTSVDQPEDSAESLSMPSPVLSTAAAAAPSSEIGSDPSSPQLSDNTEILVVPIDSIEQDSEDSWDSTMDNLSVESNQLRVPADLLGSDSGPEDVALEMPSSESPNSSFTPPPATVGVHSGAPADMLGVEIPDPIDPQPVEEPTELVEAAKKAARMIDAMAAFDGPEDKERNRRLLITYMWIAKVCSLAQENSESLRSVANKLKSSSARRALTDLASEWLIANSRDSDGILAVGQLSGGSESTIELDTGEVLKLGGSGDLPPAKRAIVMGRLTGKSSIDPVLIESLP